eukprot:7100363-Pyramimonas_sp.AAC.1
MAMSKHPAQSGGRDSTAHARAHPARGGSGWQRRAWPAGAPLHWVVPPTGPTSVCPLGLGEAARCGGRWV